MTEGHGFRSRVFSGSFDQWIPLRSLQPYGVGVTQDHRFAHLLWLDRGRTALEEEATRRVLAAMFSDNPVFYDDALESVRRENLRVVEDDG